MSGPATTKCGQTFRIAEDYRDHLPCEQCEPTFITKDSGQREAFSTGSQRDSREGKGRYDLLPANVLGYLNGIDTNNMNLAAGSDPGPAAGSVVFETLCGALDSYRAGASRTDPDLGRAAWAAMVLIGLDAGEKVSAEISHGGYFQMPATAIKRLAGLYERGAKKYNDDNWKKGQPLCRTLDSCLRHLWTWRAGDREEDHLAGVLWNIFTLIWTEQAIESGKLNADLDDLRKREHRG